MLKFCTGFVLLITMLLSGSNCFGQNQITRAEWFVDLDPGFNMANQVSSLTPGLEVDVNLNLDLSNYTTGLHTFYVRMLDNAGSWSHTLSQNFYVLSRDSSEDLSSLEWFWDIDPGFGQGNPVPNISGDTLDSSWAINLDTLAPGIHNLYVRVQDEEGLWSQSLNASSCIIAEPEALIDRFTYYYQDSLGSSDTILYSLMQAQSYVDISFEPDTSSLMGNRTYQLCINAIRTDGVMSFDACQSFSWSSSVGIDRGSLTSLVKIYPNPASGFISLELPGRRSGKMKVSLIDMRGKYLMEKVFDRTASHLQRLELPELVPAVYFLSIEMGQQVGIKKILVK